MKPGRTTRHRSTRQSRLRTVLIPVAIAVGLGAPEIARAQNEDAPVSFDDPRLLLPRAPTSTASATPPPAAPEAEPESPAPEAESAPAPIEPQTPGTAPVFDVPAPGSASPAAAPLVVPNEAVPEPTPPDAVPDPPLVAPPPVTRPSELELATRSEPTVADHKAQLNAFQVRINALRSRISGVEARVAGLKQTVLLGAVMATRAQLFHRNEMSGSFRLDSAVYKLDGEVIFSRGEDDGLSDSDEILLFDGPLTAGAHAVDVEMVFSGSAVGVFTYLQGYKFKVRSRYQLDVVEGRNTVLKVVAFEAEDITVEARDRFKVRYDVEVNDDAPRALLAE